MKIDLKINRFGYEANPVYLMYDVLVLSSQEMVHHLVRKSSEVIYPQNKCTFHLITPFKDKIDDPKVYVTYIDDVQKLPQTISRRLIVIEKNVYLPCGWDMSLKIALENNPNTILVPALTNSKNIDQMAAVLQRNLYIENDNIEKQFSWFNETAQEEVVLVNSPHEIETPVYGFDRNVSENFNRAPWGVLASVILGNSTIKAFTPEGKEDYNLLELIY